MKRKIYEKLLDWKHKEAGRTALLIDGARRVGKSYIAKEFAETEYKSYILIDFNRAPKEVVEPVRNRVVIVQPNGDVTTLRVFPKIVRRFL